MADNWAMQSFVEYVNAPLEHCHALNEKVLCDELGYSFPQIASQTTSLILYGVFSGISLTAGETVLIAPASASYAGAAAGIAVATGARVIIVGKNFEILKHLQATFPGIKIAQLTGMWKPILRLSRSTAQSMRTWIFLLHKPIRPPIFGACFKILRPYGRVSLMGINMKDIAMHCISAMFMNLTICGQYVYKNEDVRGAIKLAESGALKLNGKGVVVVVGEYQLEDVEDPFEAT